MFVKVYGGKEYEAMSFAQAVAEGREFMMRKYLGFGGYSTPQRVSAERALHKAKVRTAEGFCPYELEVIL